MRAGLLYENIHSKLFTLPDDTLVLPGHDYKGRCMSSIGEEKRLNPRLTKTRQAFINTMHCLNLPHPKQIGRALPANMKVCAGGPRAGAAGWSLGWSAPVLLRDMRRPTDCPRPWCHCCCAGRR